MPGIRQPARARGPDGVGGRPEARRPRRERPRGVLRCPDDLGVPAVERLRGLGGPGRPRGPGAGPVTARTGVAGATCGPAGPAALARNRTRRRRVRRVARRAAARADRSPGSHSPGSHSPGSHSPGSRIVREPGVAGRYRLTRRHRAPGAGRLPGARVVSGRHRRRRLTAGSMRPAAGTARVHPWRVTGMRRLSARSGGRRRAGGPQDFRDLLISRYPGRATVPGHVDQAAGRVHVRRIQYGRPAGPRSAVTASRVRRAGPEPLLAAPRGRRLRARAPLPVVRHVPGTPGGPDPGEGEHHQDHQPERDARRDHVQPDPGHVRRRAPAQKPHDRVREHQDDTRHDRHGGRHRQQDDQSHPPGRGGIRAHCSTIASRLPPRKPYGGL